MSRPLRVGDRVTATGTVTDPHGDGDVLVRWDGYSDGQGSWILPAGVTLITPAEPPVGSVVVKDGVAWTRFRRQMKADAEVCWFRQVTAFDDEYVMWAVISDGDVIFTPGGDA